jgi:hypothetical protein
VYGAAETRAGSGRWGDWAAVVDVLPPASQIRQPRHSVIVPLDDRAEECVVLSILHYRRVGLWLDVDFIEPPDAVL